MTDNYSAWRIRPEDFPVQGAISEKIQFLIGYGILAPSTHNTQPWQFKIDGSRLYINADPDISLPEGDPAGRNLQISLGACVTNILVAAESFGLKATCHWSEDVILLSFQEQAKPEGMSKDLLRAITDRYSSKMPYMAKPLKKSHLEGILAVKAPKGCSLTVVTDKDQIKDLATIHESAILEYSNNRAFFTELAKWLRPSNSKAHDGMPGFVIGLSSLQSKVLKPAVKNLKPTVKILAKKDKQAILSSSAVAFITTSGNKPQEWFNAGCYYEALALKSTSLGISTSPLVAMIEQSKQKDISARKIDLSGHPQMFFRVGYSNHKPYHTPRRNQSMSGITKAQQRLSKIIKTELKSESIQIGDYNINYVVVGKGTPILLLHGANIGWAQWYQNIGELAKHFKVYALDLPGAGGSTTVNFYKTDFEKDFVEVVDEFITSKGFKKLSIVGSSFGGWIALRLAMQKKPYIDKIVLSNPLGFTTHMPVRFRPVSFKPLAIFLSKTALRPDRKNKNLEKFMRDVFADKKLDLAPEFIDYFYELSKTSHNVLFISRLAHFKGMRKELFLGSGLGSVKTPIMLIWGKQDPLMPFSTIQSSIKLVPDLKLEVLEDIGHMPPVEDPTKFNKLTISFLKK